MEGKVIAIKSLSYRTITMGQLADMAEKDPKEFIEYHNIFQTKLVPITSAREMVLCFYHLIASHAYNNVRDMKKTKEQYGDLLDKRLVDVIGEVNG